MRVDPFVWFVWFVDNLFLTLVPRARRTRVDPQGGFGYIRASDFGAADTCRGARPFSEVLNHGQ